MKKYFLLIFIIFLSFLIGNLFDAHAIDSLVKIELRNSYRQFEKCMQSHKNDITECMYEFDKSLETHKKALKSNPENENIKSKLLLLVNTLNDIAETYYSVANKKKGNDPALSEKYYKKSAICYDRLIKLYPKKLEFSTKLKNAQYFASYEEVEKYVLELRGRKKLDYAMLSLQKLQSSRHVFNASFGQNKELNGIMNETVNMLEQKVNKLFWDTIQNGKPENTKALICLIQAQGNVIGFSNKTEHMNNLAKMENKIIQIIQGLQEDYKRDFKRINSDYKGGKYAKASEGFTQLLHKIDNFPDYASAPIDLQKKIAKATNDFDIKQFGQAVANKEKLAKATDSYLLLVEKGKNAFSRKDWLNAYNNFKKASDFTKENELAVEVDISQSWLKKTQKKIAKLDADEIFSEELALLRYKPVSYSNWLNIAKKGNFSKEYVSLSGNYQQTVDNVVILKNPTLNFDFFLETAFVGEEMNSVGLIFDKKRLLREEDYISCIGKFDDIKKMETIMGVEIQLPVFEVIWSR